MRVRLLLCNTILTILVNFGYTELVGTCPKVNEADVTFLIDSEDCSIFYKCSWGVAYKYDCPENLYFNPSLNVCDYPEQTECGSPGADIIASTEDEEYDNTEESTEVISRNGEDDAVGECPAENTDYEVHLPHATDCTLFYVCSWGVPILQKCDDSLHFNPYLGVCDWPDSAGCESETGDTGDPNESEDGDINEGSVEDEDIDEGSGEDEDVDEGNGEDEDEDGNIYSEYIVVAECPAENGDYAVHLPHESDCTLFYTCNWGVPILQECPDGLHFNPSLEVCDWPDSAGCGNETENVDADEESGDGNLDEGSGESEDVEAGSGDAEDVNEGSGEDEDVEEDIGEGDDNGNVVAAECPVENGEYAVHLPHESDCTLFYTCNWGVPILQECPDGLHFNHSLEVCDWPDSAGCGNETENVDADEESGDGNLDEGSGESEDIEAGSGDAEDVDEGSGEDEDIEEVIGEGDNGDVVAAECPAENGEYAMHLPHETDCTLFYTCNWGVPILQECPDGLHFNPCLEVCDWPDSAGCGNGTENVDAGEESGDGNLDEGSGEGEDIEDGSGDAEDVDEGSGEDEDVEEDIDEGDNGDVVAAECPAENGEYAVHLPHETDCTLFYTCNWGVPILQECPDGLHFNPSLEVCDWPDSAGCGNGTENVDADEDSTDRDLDEGSGESEDIEDGSGDAEDVGEGSGEDEDVEEDIDEDDNNGDVVAVECPAENGEYAVHLPHETDCTLFYTCNWGVPILQECPDGLHFNPSLEVCDWPDSAGCGNGTENVDADAESGDGNLDEGSGESEDIEDGSGDAEDVGKDSGEDEDIEEDIDEGDNGDVVAVECPAENGEYAVHRPHETDCTLFYTCNWGVPILQECPDGLHFNPSMEVCDWPDSAGCGNGTENVDADEESGDGNLDEGSGESEDVEDGSGDAEDVDEGSGEDEDVEEDIDEGDNGDVVAAECPAENGEYAVLLPHETDCTFFYTCNWGVPILQECPDGLHFNPSLEVCDWPDSAGCGNGTENVDADEESEDGDLVEGSSESEDVEDGSGDAENVDEGSSEDENVEEDVDEGDDNGDVVAAECPAENGEYAVHLPHETDCTLFYTCNWSVPILQECPDGLHFNPSLEVCDWPDSAGCSSGTENVDGDDESEDGDLDEVSGESEDIEDGSGETEDVEDDVDEGDDNGDVVAAECPAENGEYAVHLPHETDCTLFYTCNWGVPILQECPDGLHFNPSLEVCDWPDSAGCSSGTENVDGDDESEDGDLDEVSGESEDIEDGSGETEDVEDDVDEGNDNENVDAVECPVENGEYAVHLPHESDCTLFYTCNWDVPILQECPDGLHFNPSLEVCDWPDSAGCSSGTENVDGDDESEDTDLDEGSDESEDIEDGSGETEDVDEGSGEDEVVDEDIDEGDDNENVVVAECPLENGEYAVHFPHESDCTLFYTCNWGVPILQECPDGLHFNPSLEVCDWPDSAGCQSEAENSKEADGDDGDDDVNNNNEQEYLQLTNVDDISHESDETNYKSNEINKNPVGECPSENIGNSVLLPHESDCSLFYECNWGEPILMECPDGHFNPSLNSCDYSSVAGCEVDENGSGDDESGDNDEESNENEQEDLQITNGASTYDESDENSYESSEVNNNPEGECPSENNGDMVLLPHASNCSLFYECDWGEPILKECPGDLHFNPLLNVCDYPEEAGCELVGDGSGDGESSDGVIADAIEEYHYNTASENGDGNESGTELCYDTICLPGDDEFIPNTSDCTKFCKCSWGLAYKFSCPASLYFNPILNVCEYPEISGCIT